MQENIIDQCYTVLERNLREIPFILNSEPKILKPSETFDNEMEDGCREKGYALGMQFSGISLKYVEGNVVGGIPLMTFSFYVHCFYNINNETVEMSNPETFIGNMLLLNKFTDNLADGRSVICNIDENPYTFSEDQTPYIFQSWLVHIIIQG